jgi:hypothetical protein
LGRIGGPRARQALQAALAAEGAPEVRQEIIGALEESVGEADAAAAASPERRDA